jgi:hypothetical protein
MRPRMNAGAQAVQGEASPGATSAHLSRQAMCYHREKPKSLEGSKLSCSTSRQHSLHTPAQWRRNGVPCASFVALIQCRSHGLIITGRKDLGNTNFSIHLPRSSFNRHATAQVVLRAVRSLDIDACVNDRNDVCVGPYKMSSTRIAISKRNS